MALISQVFLLLAWLVNLIDFPHWIISQNIRVPPYASTPIHNHFVCNVTRFLLIRCMSSSVLLEVVLKDFCVQSRNSSLLLRTVTLFVPYSSFPLFNSSQKSLFWLHQKGPQTFPHLQRRTIFFRKNKVYFCTSKEYMRCVKFRKMKELSCVTSFVPLKQNSTWSNDGTIFQGKCQEYFRRFDWINQNPKRKLRIWELRAWISKGSAPLIRYSSWNKVTRLTFQALIREKHEFWFKPWFQECSKSVAIIFKVGPIC